MPPPPPHPGHRRRAADPPLPGARPGRRRLSSPCAPTAARRACAPSPVAPRRRGAGPRPARHGRQGRADAARATSMTGRSSSCRPATARPRRSTALDLGANDYVEKPFGVGELLARLRAALRQTARRASGDRADRPRAMSPSTWTSAWSRAAGERGPADAQGIRPAGPSGAQRRQGRRPTADLLTAVWGPAHARGRPVSARLRRPAAPEAGARSRRARADRDRTRRRLSPERVRRGDRAEGALCTPALLSDFNVRCWRRRGPGLERGNQLTDPSPPPAKAFCKHYAPARAGKGAYHRQSSQASRGAASWGRCWGSQNADQIIL